MFEVINKVIFLRITLPFPSLQLLYIKIMIQLIGKLQFINNENMRAHVNNTK